MKTRPKFRLSRRQRSRENTSFVGSGYDLLRQALAFLHGRAGVAIVSAGSNRYGSRESDIQPATVCATLPISLRSLVLLGWNQP